MATKKTGNAGQFQQGKSGNPKGRPKSKVRAVFDSWYSMLSGVGTSRDKRTHLNFQAEVVPYATAKELWKGDCVAAKAVDLPADDMTRAGFSFTVQDEEGDAGEDKSKDLQDKVLNKWAELDVMGAFKEALGYESAYGGAAILMGAFDAKKLSEPLDLNNVSAVNYLTVLEARELQPLYHYTNPEEANYGKVQVYTLVPDTYGTPADASESQAPVNTLIHESRLLIFPGIRVSRSQEGTEHGWGDGVFTRMWPVLRDFNASWDGAGITLQNFSQVLFKMVNLAELMGKADGEAKLAKRLNAINTSRSMINMVVMDTEEEMIAHTANVTGLAELLREYGARMAGAADMPITKLLGTSPGGMNATGESDNRNWYDRMASKQRTKLIPLLDRLTRAILSSIGVKDAMHTIEPNPLWLPTDKEVADTRKTQAETDQIYVQIGSVSPEDIAVSRFKGDKYSYETVVDFDTALFEPADPPQEETPNNEDPPAPEVGAEDLPKGEE